MADISLSSGSICRPYRSPWGAYPTRLMKLSTGLSSNKMYVGSCVGLDPNSTAFQDSISPSSQSSNTIVSTCVVGIAAANPLDPSNSGLNVTSTTPGALGSIPVWEANPLVEFRANSRNGLLNSTLVGQAHDLLWDSTLNILLVNVGASSLATPMPRVIITGLIDNSGDSGGAVSFRFVAKDPTSSLSTGRLLALFA